MYKDSPSTISYFTLCQPVGLMWYIFFLSSVGIISFPMFANATPTRPSESKSLYFSKDFVVKSDSEKNGILALITV